MTWVKLDDAFFDHPKIIGLSDAAQLAFLQALCYANRNLTDGFVPFKKAKEIAGRSKALAELVPTLWETCEGGFLIHDFLEYQPSRAKVLADRSAAKDRMFGKRSGNVRANKSRSSHVPVPVPVVPVPDPQTPSGENTLSLPVGFSYKTEPLEPDEPGFVGEYVRHFEARHGKHPPGTHLGDARSLERDFGTAACVQAASDLDWDKPPAYLRPRMEDQRGKSNGANSGKPAAPTGTERVAARLRGLGQ